MNQAEIERVLIVVMTLVIGSGALWTARLCRAAWIYLLAALLLLSGLSELFAPGREIFGAAPFLPGTWATRLLSLELPGALRRALEPAGWALLLVLSWGASVQVGRARIALLASAVVFSLLRSAEISMLAALPFGRAPGFLIDAAASPAASLAALVGLILVALALSEILRGRATAPDRGHRFLIPVLIALLCSGVVLRPALRQRDQQPMLVGAHYYSWFPENWGGSYIGQKLVPPMKPELGEYDSSDPAVFQRHVAWAQDAGIDFFIFDWWSKRPNVRRRVLRQADWLDRNEGMQFSIHFEALDLKEKKDTPVPGEDANVVMMNSERADRLKRQWEYLARHYMKRPSYLRENGAAVLFVYATRHLVGPVREAITAARQHVKATTGVDLYIVGDEVYFNVLRYSKARGVYLAPEGQPDWDRLLAFDAITAYNPYDESRRQTADEAGANRFLSDVEALYARYRSVAATASIKFIPTVLPGYNDRGVRPKENHFVLPRFFGPLTDQTLFGMMLYRLASCRFTADSGFLVITSWNEWNEGTQIEPARLSPLTREDVSGSREFSQGALLGGYGTLHLDELRGLPSECE